MGLTARLRLARLYLCTDARERQGDLADFLAAALAGGVDVVQLRQPGLRPEARRAALEVVRTATARRPALVGVDGPPVLAGELGADLLHLEQGDGSAAAARASLHPAALLGRSTHDADQADAALADDDLDHLWVGPVRAPTAPAGRPVVGLELVRHVARAAPVFTLASKPWFAAGGVTVRTLDPLLEAGARRVCVSTAITSADDPQDAAEQLSRRLRDAWRADPAAQRYTFAAAADTGRG